MKRTWTLALLPILLTGCKEPARRSAEPEPGPAPPTPVVDAAFIKKAFDPDTLLATDPLVADLDAQGGKEALVAIKRADAIYQLAVVDGNARVLSRTPLGGKMISGAHIQALGTFRLEPGLAGGESVVLLPVETLVYKQYLCGMFTLRYRSEMLVLTGELGCKCWRKVAGADRDRDPYELIKIARDEGDTRIEMEGDRGTYTYRWKPEQAAFVAELDPVPEQK